MKKKKLSSLLLSGMMLLTAVVFPTTATAANVGVSVNGSPVTFNSTTGIPYIDSANRTQVPMRAAMEAYGCEVSWDDATKTATLTKNGKTVQVPIGQKKIVVNGNEVITDTAATIKEGRTYLPIRPVYEAFGGYVGWDSASSSVTADSSNPLVQVHFLNVGQGDSCLIDSGDFEVLIDASIATAGDTIVSGIKPYVDGSLDLVIATHPDADHIGGMSSVFSAYQVDRVVDSGATSTTATYKKYVSAVEAEPNCVHETDDNMDIALGNTGAKLKIIETGDSAAETNDLSVVSELIYGNCKVLFPGDMGAEIEKANLGLFEDVDVLKVAHHGSSKSSCAEFLSIVKPEYAVVSYGSGNSYGHPHALAVSRLMNVGAKILGTAKSGDIVLSTNGVKYSFNKSDYLSAADAGGQQVTTTTTTTTTTPTPATTVTTPTVTTPVVTTPVVTTPTTTNAATYIGNKNTKKYHLPGCSSVKRMKEANKVSLTKEEAVALGYTPCANCNP